MRKRENKNWWLVWVAMCCLSFTTQAVPLVEDIPVSSITISPSIDTLFLGQKLTLTCKFLPVNATQKSVFWISDDENVATVKAVNDSMAVVTAQSKGVVTILATTEDGLFLNARLKLIVDDFYDKVFLIDSISYRMSREEALAVDVVGFIETTHLIIPDSVKILDDLYSVKSILLEKGKTLKKKLAALSVPSTVKRILLREDCIGKNFSVYVSDLEAWCHTDFEGEYPDSVAIYLNNKLITDLDIPGSYGYLGRAVFVNNKNLRGVNIGEGVTSVNAYAFAGCSNLERVILPKSLKEISYGMFRECKNLRGVDIGEGVTSVNAYAFAGCSNLERVILPESLKEIPDGMFEDCENLKHINLPQELQNIGSVAFSCTGLKEINLPKSLKMIGYGAFSYCNNLVSVIVPDSVNTLYNTFISCGSLQTVVLGEGLKTIGRSTFGYCTRLSEIYIPAGVTKIDQKPYAATIGYAYWGPCEKVRAIYGCRNLQRVVVSPDNKYYYDIDGVLFDKGKNDLLYYPEGRTSVKYDVPEGVDTIASYAFYYVKDLKSIHLPTTLKIIGYRALPGSLTAIMSQSMNPPERNYLGIYSLYEGAVSSGVEWYVPLGAGDRYKMAYGIDVIETSLLNVDMVDGDEKELRFYVLPDGRLSVSGVLVDTIIEIYSINGRQIYKGIAGDIPYLGQGLYLVKIGDETCKVII